MKPVIILFFLLITLFKGLPGYAQWSFGGRAGVNMCKTTGQMDDGPDYYKAYIYWLAMPTGFGMFEYRFNKFLSVGGELGYTTIGNETISLYDEFIPYSNNYSYRFWGGIASSA